MLDCINPPATSDLATRIDAEHVAVGQALQSALTHAIACGKLLIEAKLRFGEYGEWSPWLMDNCSGSARTARVYGNVLPISVRQAVDLINTQRRSDSEPRSPPQATVWKRNHETFVSWAVDWAITDTLIDITRIRDKANGTPPKPSTVAKAARQGRTPGLTAESLRAAITLLTSYAEALERP